MAQARGVCLFFLMFTNAEAHSMDSCSAEDSANFGLKTIALIQSNKKTIKKQEMAASAMPLAETVNHKPFEWETAFDQLAANVANNNGKIDNVTKTALAGMRATVLDILNYVVSSVKEDQGEVDRALNVVVSCDKHLDLGDEELKNAASQKEGEHATCRTSEASLKANTDVVCTEYTTAVSNPAPPGCMSTFSATPTPAEYASVVECVGRIATWSTSCNASLTQKKNACDEATASKTAQTQVCNAAQSIYEQYFCSYYQRVTGGCSEYSSCRAKAVSDQATVYAAVKLAQSARKAEYVAADRILCFLDVLNSTGELSQDLLTGCFKNDTITVTQLDIVYHDAPPPKPCDTAAVASKPCDDEWQTNQYMGKPWYSTAPTTTCTACVTSAPTPAPTPGPTQE